MKINWGLGITLVALSFVVFILQLVCRCTNEKVDLVNEKYYEQEIRYQEQIDRRTNVNSLQQKIDITVEGQQLEVVYPKSATLKDIAGTITLFRPDDSSLDFVVPVRPEKEGRQLVAMNKKKPGRWKVQITWTDGEVPFYQEENIWIN